MYGSKTQFEILDCLSTHCLEYIMDNIIPYWEKDFSTCINENCIEVLINTLDFIF